MGVASSSCHLTSNVIATSAQKNPCCLSNKNETGNGADQSLGWSKLLCQHENTYAGDPEQVHHAKSKQETHQCPTAPQTVASVLEAHPKGTPRSPRAIQWLKAPLETAMSQTGVFQTAELKETSTEQQSRTKGFACALHHW
jgi:hypothetical protein